MFSNEFLNEKNVQWRDFEKNELIFRQDQPARYFYQIDHGSVKLFSVNEEGKEFIQRFFQAGESFGEPPLLGDFNYPVHAVATVQTRVFYVPKERFFQWLMEHPEDHLKLTQKLAKRLLYKSSLLKEISFENPKHRIMALLNFLKQEQQKKGVFKVNYTRNEIANMTGLRIETVIRTIKLLEKEKLLELRNKKIHL